MRVCYGYNLQLDLTGFLSLQNLAETEEMVAHGMDDSVSTWNAAIVRNQKESPAKCSSSSGYAPECKPKQRGLTLKAYTLKSVIDLNETLICD